MIEKQTVDVFLCPRLGQVVEELNPEQCVVYGVVTEICVYYAVKGLLERGKQVTVVTDAVKELKPEDAAREIGELQSAGLRLANVSDIC